jgi:hypothetical protein
LKINLTIVSLWVFGEFGDLLCSQQGAAQANRFARTPNEFSPVISPFQNCHNLKKDLDLGGRVSDCFFRWKLPIEIVFVFRSGETVLLDDFAEIFCPLSIIIVAVRSDSSST